ncbi:MAG: RNA-binding protein [Chitinophagaceae bacterium]
MDILISNIGQHVSRYDIRRLFEAFGSVRSVKLITNLQTGESRGVARISMPFIKEAKMAIERLDGADIEGQFVSVAIVPANNDQYHNI